MPKSWLLFGLAAPSMGCGAKPHAVGSALPYSLVLALGLLLLSRTVRIPWVRCNKCNSFPLDRDFPLYYGRGMKVYLNAAEIAKLLNVNRATVTRWAQKGQLKGAIRVKDKQQWRIPLTTYEQLIKQHRAQRP